MNKKVYILVAMVLLLVSTQVKAADNDSTAVGQIMLSGSQIFWQTEDETVSGFFYASAFSNVNNGYLALFTYSGAQIKLTDNISIYPLFLTFNDEQGISIGPSLWLEISQGKNCLFLEGDYYVPWLSSQSDVPGMPHQYYGYADISHSLKDGVSMGLAYETMGTIYDDQPFESAIGPYVQIKNTRIWFLHDETPLADGDVWGLRLKFNWF
jgi:hypothetical protein